MGAPAVAEFLEVIPFREMRWVVALAAVVAMFPGDALGNVVLHEYIAPDPADDLRLGATTQDGSMAAAIETQSGPVSSPDLAGASGRKGVVYGSDRDAARPETSYHADSDTTRPQTVSYDDPFTPGIAPFKREFAYDSVNPNFDLIVRDPSQTRVAIGGTARPEDDQFYADFEVNFDGADAVRVPTVGPGARLLAVRTVPETHVQLFHDGADNWFIKGDRPGRVRLVLHIAVDRAVFGSSFADVDWTRLWRFAPPLPASVKTEGVRIARQNRGRRRHRARGSPRHPRPVLPRLRAVERAPAIERGGALRGSCDLAQGSLPPSFVCLRRDGARARHPVALRAQ